jgi:hypothetical protein
MAAANRRSMDDLVTFSPLLPIVVLPFGGGEPSLAAGRLLLRCDSKEAAMRRTGWLLGVVLLSLVPATATAGGFDSLRFEHQYYAPGQLAHGSTEFWVEVATVENREPYYTYLLSDRKTFEPPVIPEAAIPLGELTIDLLPKGEANPARASLEFRVPEVAPGGYQVVLCNRPCRDDTVGALIGGSIHVAATAEEARLLNFGDKLERRLDRRLFDQLDGIWTDMGSLRERMVTLDARVSGIAIQARRGETVDEDLISRMDRAETQLVTMERQVTDLANRPGWPSSPLHWIVLASGWLVALAVAWLWIRGALRARRPQSTTEEHSVDLGELTPRDETSASVESAGDWWARSGPAPSMTAASRRAMSLAGNGRKLEDA